MKRDEIMKRAEELVDDKPKIGDICRFWDYSEKNSKIAILDNIFEYGYQSVYSNEVYKNCEVIKNPENVNLKELLK